MRPDRNLPLIECFGPTIQGEGVLAGQKTHFLRFGGCPRRCVWCDSMHAVLPEEVKKNSNWLYPQEILSRVLGLEHAPWVTISGGDPLMWDMSLLVEKLHEQGYKVAVETQGDLERDWVDDVDCLTISPKPPSAGPQDGIPNYRVISKYTEELGPQKAVLKVVVFDEEDLDFAEKMHDFYPQVPFYISTGTDHPIPPGTTDDHLRLMVADRYRDITEMALKRDAFWDVSIFPQLHVMAWGSKLEV